MLTIIVPTRNRSDFLIRLLNYYADTNYKYQISIGDSSDDFHSENAKTAIKKLNGKLKITYRQYPKLTEPQCTSQLIDLVSTPYLAWLADDDLLVGNGLTECIHYLEGHSEYSITLGKAIFITLTSNGPYGQIANISPYLFRSIESDSASKRLLDHLTNYTNPNFGVHRTAEFRAAYSHTRLFQDIAFAEILPNSISCIQGKIKQLDCLYLIRQGHEYRYPTPDQYDWITGSNWFSAYQIFHDRLIRELTEKEGITQAKAQDIIREAFWMYLSVHMVKQHQNYYGQKGVPGIRRRIKSLLKRIPFLVDARRGASLASLLKPSSPYRNDFMPVYNAMTKPYENYRGVNQ